MRKPNNIYIYIYIHIYDMVYTNNNGYSRTTLILLPYLDSVRRTAQAREHVVIYER
jgi:hypothetical protein